MANTSPEIVQPTETQRAEIAANKFYDMAEKGLSAKDLTAREMFSGVGRETAQGNFSGAQRILEREAQWDDTLRGAASEVNHLDQERSGAKPLSFAEAQNAMSGYARLFEGDKDLKAAAEIDSIVGGTSRPGVEGIDKALKYIEGTLKCKVNVADFTAKGTEKEFVRDWQEKRTIRDALYQEKQKRVEQLKQSQRGTEELTRGRGATATRLEQAFTQAGIPEDTASRQEFLRRAGAMSAEELHFRLLAKN